MTIYLIASSFLNFLGALLLAFAVVLRGRSNRLNQQFGLFAVTIAAWSAGYFLWQISEDPERALFFTRVLMLGAYFVPVTHLHFVSRLCGESRRRWMVAGYGLACVFVGLGFTPLMVHHVERAMDFPFWPRAGRFFIVYIVFFAVYTARAWYLLARNLRGATDARAGPLRYILVASTIGFSGGATNFPLWYYINVPPVGNGLILLYLIIMAHAVSRYHLPLVTYDFVKAAVYIAIGATLAIFYVLVVTVAGVLVGANISSGGMLNGFLLAMLVTVFFLWSVPQLRQQAERILEQVYLRRGHGQRGQLRDLARRICSLSDEQEIFETATREIAAAMGVAQAGMFFRGEFDNTFTLRASLAWGQAGFTTRSLGGHEPLIHFFQDRKVPLVFDGSETECGAGGRRAAHRAEGGHAVRGGVSRLDARTICWACWCWAGAATRRTLYRDRLLPPRGHLPADRRSPCARASWSAAPTRPRSSSRSARWRPAWRTSCAIRWCRSRLSRRCSRSAATSRSSSRSSAPSCSATWGASPASWRMSPPSPKTARCRSPR